jgi:hypothetical protein
MLLLVLPLLTACGGPNPSTAQGQCEIAANDDPAVKAAMQQQAMTVTWSSQFYDAVTAARKRAVQRCLRARGLAPPGGVEAVRPPS